MKEKAKPPGAHVVIDPVADVISEGLHEVNEKTDLAKATNSIKKVLF